MKPMRLQRLIERDRLREIKEADTNNQLKNITT